MSEKKSKVKKRRWKTMKKIVLIIILVAIVIHLKTIWIGAIQNAVLESKLDGMHSEYMSKHPEPCNNMYMAYDAAKEYMLKNVPHRSLEREGFVSVLHFIRTLRGGELQSFESHGKYERFSDLRLAAHAKENGYVLKSRTSFWPFAKENVRWWPLVKEKYLKLKPWYISKNYSVPIYIGFGNCTFGFLGGMLIQKPSDDMGTSSRAYKIRLKYSDGEWNVNHFSKSYKLREMSWEEYHEDLLNNWENKDAR